MARYLSLAIALVVLIGAAVTVLTAGSGDIFVN